MNSTNQPTTLAHEIDLAETKALDSLARYKFSMFGYWAGIWVHLNRIEGKRRPNPFSDLVKLAVHIRDKHPAPFRAIKTDLAEPNVNPSCFQPLGETDPFIGTDEHPGDYFNDSDNPGYPGAW